MLPTGRHGQKGMKFDLARVIAGRVQKHAVPLNGQDFLADHHAALRRIGWCQEVKRHHDLLRLGGHLHLKGVNLNRVPPPRQLLLTRLDAQASEQRNRCSRRMISRQPLWKQKRQRPAGPDRYDLAYLQDSAQHILRIHVQTDGSGIGNVAGRRDREAQVPKVFGHEAPSRDPLEEIGQQQARHRQVAFVANIKPGAQLTCLTPNP